MKRTALLLLCLVALGADVNAQSVTGDGRPRSLPPAQQLDHSYRVRKIHEAAQEKPSDEESFKRYIDELPRDGDYYVVEGDLLLTKEELIALLTNRDSTGRQVDAESKLVVNLVQGKEDIYPETGGRTLNYAVDKSSFPSEQYYNEVVKNLGVAAREWQEACPGCAVRFVHLAEHDPAPSHEKVSFIVRYHDAKGSYSVSAFFPHQSPQKRYINIDPSYFKTGNNGEGLFRHALGHALGYRHHQSSVVRGCYKEGETWKRFVEDDTETTMKYYCGGERGLDLKISDSDARGHRRLYSGEAGADRGAERPEGKHKLIIRFDGADVAENAASVLSILHRLNLLKIETHKAKNGDGLETIYREYLKIPFSANKPEFKKFASEITNKPINRLQYVQVDEEIKYPDINVDKYTYSRRFAPDSAELKNVRDFWTDVTEKVVQEPKLGTVRVYLIGYRIELALDSVEKLREVTNEIRSIERTNVRLYSYTSGKEQEQKFFSADDAKVFFDTYRDKEVAKGTQGALGAFVSLPDLPDCAKKRTNDVPRLVLIDKAVHLHPDIAPAIAEGGIEPASAPEIKAGKYVFGTVLFDKNVDHGTHMAGIIASQDDEIGLIGVHPGAHILNINWDNYKGEKIEDLAGELERREGGNRHHIFTMASEWNYKAENIMPRQLDVEDHFIVTQIMALGLKWITAAGDTPGGGQEIQKVQPNGPMNLGYLPSVIVVTACEDCNTPNARLTPGANYSGSLVHIAAPGVGIPSTVSGGKYAVVGGTSQATAFAAGVASAMLACYPTYAWKSPKVKERLQVTSRPLPVTSSRDYLKIAAGVLDARMALLDPEKHWLKVASGQLKAFDNIAWCAKDITARNSSLISTFDILRIMNKDNQIWIYAKPRPSRGKENGEVLRFGPLSISQEEKDKPLLKVAGGPVLRLSQIEDLLLSQPVANISPCRLPVP